MVPEHIIYQDVTQLFQAEAGRANYQQIRNIVEKKVEDLMIKQGPWQLFLDAIMKEHGENINDISALPFPAYNLKIPLASEESESYILKRQLCIDVSLVSKHYTIYFEDFYNFSEYMYEEAPMGKILVHFYVLFYKTMTTESFKRSASNADDYVRQFFPEYQFVSHNVLFNYKVDNLLPYQADDINKEKVFSLYDFAMSRHYEYKNIKVII